MKYQFKINWPWISILWETNYQGDTDFPQKTFKFSKYLFDFFFLANLFGQTEMVFQKLEFCERYFVNELSAVLDKLSLISWISYKQYAVQQIQSQQ